LNSNSQTVNNHEMKFANFLYICFNANWKSIWFLVNK